jgi:hypothetical protein
MNLKHALLIPAAATFVLAFSSTPALQAQCGGMSGLLGHRTSLESLRGTQLGGQPRLLRTAYQKESEPYEEPSVVGMWHVKFLSEGNKGIPNGAEVDAGFAQWHEDGTEIMNSGGRAPSTSNFCLGVWERTGIRSYMLNHFAISWDPTPTTASPDGVILGPANILENITLSTDGNSFVGSFSIIQYDETLKKLADIKGTIKGTRVTVDTLPSSIF